jgi:hypothetical protein
LKEPPGASIARITAATDHPGMPSARSTTPTGGNDTVSEKPSQNHQNKPRIKCRGFSFFERGKTSKKEFGYKSVIKASKLDIKKDNKKGPEGPISCLN